MSFKWKGKNFSFYTNTKCEYFPCHKTDNIDEFNCLFCYCPLYALGKNCGGNPKFTENGIKDCSDCMLPHGKFSFGQINDKFMEIVEITRKSL